MGSATSQDPEDRPKLELNFGFMSKFRIILEKRLQNPKYASNPHLSTIEAEQQRAEQKRRERRRVEEKKRGVRKRKGRDEIADGTVMANNRNESQLNLLQGEINFH